MAAAVGNAVAKDALSLINMECGGKCVLFTLTGTYELLKMAAKYLEHTLANQSVVFYTL